MGELSLFCRHNRFTADCPICSKGTVLEGGRRPARRSTAAKPKREKADRASSPAFSGPHVRAGPYEDDAGSYEVRLERVPGGVRLAEWASTGLRRRAPVLRTADLPALVEAAAEVLDARDGNRLTAALSVQPEPQPDRHGVGVSRGRSGDFKEELRVEPLPDGRVRVGRWVLRPGSGWELQDAPPMLPAGRYAEALGDAARQGLPLRASDAGDAARL